MTVLFMEVVRLGDAVDKMTDGVGSVNRNYDYKIQELEERLAANDKHILSLSQRNNTGTEAMNDLGEKVMNRLQTAESNLLLLGKEQVKDK